MYLWHVHISYIYIRFAVSFIQKQYWKGIVTTGIHKKLNKPQWPTCEPPCRTPGNRPPFPTIKQPMTSNLARQRWRAKWWKNGWISTFRNLRAKCMDLNVGLAAKFLPKWPEDSIHRASMSSGNQSWKYTPENHLFEKGTSSSKLPFWGSCQGCTTFSSSIAGKSKDHLWVMSLSKEQSCQDRFCDCCHGFQRWPDRTVKDSWFRGMVRVHKQHSMVNAKYPLLVDSCSWVFHCKFWPYLYDPSSSTTFFVCFGSLSLVCFSNPWEKIGNCCLFYLFQLCFALVGSRGPFIPVAVKWAERNPLKFLRVLNIPKAQVKLKHSQPTTKPNQNIKPVIQCLSFNQFHITFGSLGDVIVFVTTVSIRHRNSWDWPVLTLISVTLTCRLKTDE